MEQIYLDQYTFEKKADKPLEGGILQWPSEIVKQLFIKYPELSQYKYSLDYSHINEKTKSAKGSVVLGETVEIPFIIEQAMLKPMLVFHPAGQPITSSMPITSQAVAEEFKQSSTFSKGLTEKTKGTSPRLNSSSTTVIQTKTASLLDTINGTVHEEDKNRLIEGILSDTKLVTSMKNHDTLPILEKVSKLEILPEENLELETDKDIYYIYKNAGLGYTKLSSNSSIYDPKIEILQSIDKDTPLYKTSSTRKLVEMAKTAGVSNTLSLGNGHFRIVDLDTEDKMILVNEKGNYINNFEKSASFDYSEKEINLPVTTELQEGDSVLVKTAEGRYFGPVKISSVCKVKGKRQISGTHKLKKASFVETDKLNKTVVDTKTNTFYTPYNEYIKLSAKENLKNLFRDFVKSSHTVAKRNGQYYLIGPEFDKLASYSGNTNPYTKDEAMWMLIQAGAGDETIKEAEQLSRGEFPVMDKLQAPGSKTRILEKTAQDLTLIRKYIDQTFKGLVKEATSSIADKKALDVILGLNLINEENLITIIENVGIIEAALNIVSQLYLMSLVGLNTLNRGALEIVLEKLSLVRDTVKQLEYVLKT